MKFLPQSRGGRFALLGVLAVTHYLCVLCLGLREAGGDYDDGRAWGLILTLVVPAAVALAWALLLATTGARRPPLVGSSDRSPSTNGPSLRR